MNLNKPAVIKKLQERFRNVNAGRGLYTAFLVPTMLTMFSTRAFAADTIWTKASAIMQDVYTQILGISTIAAVVTAAIALLLMNFSRSGRTVDESRAWLKRIIITWAILNSLGFIMAYVTPFFFRWHLDSLITKENQDMKNIICFLSGIVAGIAMCLTAAYYLPESSFDDELGHF